MMPGNMPVACSYKWDVNQDLLTEVGFSGTLVFERIQM